MARPSRLDVSPGGGGGMSRVVSRMATKSGQKAATKIGDKVGQKTAESIKPTKVSTQGKKFTKKVEGTATTKSKSGGTSTAPNAKTVSGTTKKPTAKEVAGRQKAADTKRNNAIVKSAADARDASAKIVGKEVIKKRGYKSAAALVALDDLIQRNKNKK